MASTGENAADSVAGTGDNAADTGAGTGEGLGRGMEDPFLLFFRLYRPIGLVTGWGDGTGSMAGSVVEVSDADFQD